MSGINAYKDSSNVSGYVYYGDSSKLASKGWYFNSPHLRTNIRMRPEYSEDGRTTIGNTYTMQLRALVTDQANALPIAFGCPSAYGTSASTGAKPDIINDVRATRGNMQKLRAILSKNGQCLVIRGFGYDLTVNGGTSTSLFDVRWGPKTLELAMEHIGTGGVYQVDWTVEFCIPECYDSTGGGSTEHTTGTDDATSYIDFPYTVAGASKMGLIEHLSFGISYGITSSGLTTRVISGSLSIAINRANALGLGEANKITAVSDGVRESINPAVPLGFQRISQEWKISPDKRILNFVIIDQELPSENPYPQGVLNMTLDQHVQTAGNESAHISPFLQCGFTGVIEVMKGWPIGLAFDKAILIIQYRLDLMAAFFKLNNPGVDTAPIIIQRVSVVESLYGPRRVSFEVIFKLFTSPKSMFTNIFGSSAMFTPVEFTVPDVNFAAYRNSMKDTAWTQRGLAQLVFTPEEDLIVGPCEPQIIPVNGDLQPILPTSYGGGSLLSRCPSSGYDYQLYRNSVKLIDRTGNVVHTPYAKSTDTPASTGTIVGADIPFISPADAVNAATNALTGKVSIDGVRTRVTGDTGSGNKGQRTTALSQIKVCVFGTGVRLGRFPAVPTFNQQTLAQKYKDLEIIKIGDGEVSYSRLGKDGNCSRLGASWKVCYSILGSGLASDVATLLIDLENSLIASPDDTDGKKIGGKSSTDGM